MVSSIEENVYSKLDSLITKSDVGIPIEYTFSGSSYAVSNTYLLLGYGDIKEGDYVQVKFVDGNSSIQKLDIYGMYNETQGENDYDRIAQISLGETALIQCTRPYHHVQIASTIRHDSVVSYTVEYLQGNANNWLSNGKTALDKCIELEDAISSLGNSLPWFYPVNFNSNLENVFTISHATNDIYSLKCNFVYTATVYGYSHNDPTQINLSMSKITLLEDNYIIKDCSAVGGFIGLSFDRSTCEFTFTPIKSIPSNNVIVAVLYRNMVYMGPCSRLFTNIDSTSKQLNYPERLNNVYSSTASVFGGKVLIDTNEKTVKIDNAFVTYGGGKHTQITSEASYADNLHPTYVQHVFVDATAKSIHVYDSDACNSNNVTSGNLMLICAFYNGKIVYSTNTLKEVWYINGKDFYDNSTDDSVTLLSTLNRLTCKIFKRVCCIGDSYTDGYIVNSDGVVTSNAREFSWPTFMASLTGCIYDNYGHSGATVRSWWTCSRGYKQMNTDDKHYSAYIIGLMINDASTRDVHVDVGTIDDIDTDADTYYAWMCKIVKLCGNRDPLAHIFIQSCPRDNTTFAPYNQAVYDIVEYYKDTYNVHCLDLLANANLYTNTSLTGDSTAGHYTAIGYEQFSEILAYIWSQYINANTSLFRDAFEIPYSID